LEGRRERRPSFSTSVEDILRFRTLTSRESERESTGQELLLVVVDHKISRGETNPKRERYEKPREGGSGGKSLDAKGRAAREVSKLRGWKKGRCPGTAPDGANSKKSTTKRMRRE